MRSPRLAGDDALAPRHEAVEDLLDLQPVGRVQQRAPGLGPGVEQLVPIAERDARGPEEVPPHRLVESVDVLMDDLQARIGDHSDELVASDDPYVVGFFEIKRRGEMLLQTLRYRIGRRDQIEAAGASDANQL